jgi:hypothetical protein
MNRGEGVLESDNTGRYAMKSARKPVIRVEECLQQDAGRLQDIFRNGNVILIFLKVDVTLETLF